MQDPRWNLHGTTFSWFNVVDSIHGSSSLVVGDVLLPDENGAWTVFPEGNGVVATVRFQAVSNATRALEEAAADVVMDGRVDMLDLGYVALRFGSSLGDNRWGPRADLNGDSRIDMKDLSAVAERFGKIYEVVPELVF